MTWYQAMGGAFFNILKSPFQNTEALWLLIPIFLLWIIFEVYFDLHKTEPLGWNSALGNGVSMFWIGINLMTFLFALHRAEFRWTRFSAALLIIGYAIFISYIAFTHKFKAKTTFLLASPTPIYFISSVGIVWTFGSLPMTWWVILDLILLFPVILGLEMLFRKYAPDRGGEDVSAPIDRQPTEQMPEDFKF